VPFVGSSKPSPTSPEPAAAPAPARTSQTRPGTAAADRPATSDDVIDRVVCVVNKDAITLFELEEAEAFYVYESRQPAPQGEARRELRLSLLDRLIDSRLQLQQAERERLVVDDAELAESMADIMKRLNVRTDQELEAALREQGVSLEGVKRRIRDGLLIQKVVRRKVALRISVTEQEIDRYFAENRDKLESGLTFEARHILFQPEPGSGEAGWEAARQRAEQVAGLLRSGEDFVVLARQYSDDATRQDGGALGRLKRGELAPEIETEILRLPVGGISPPFRSGVGYHLFKLDSRESLSGESLAQARNQIRDILFREKYQARLKEWLADIRRQALIDVRL
jgi:peptidyl-prolyl cis-trans isomerase SurA